MAICCKCNKEITERVINAMGKSWHPEHFACRYCKQPIRSDTYNVVEDEPVCTDCYTERHVDQCCCCEKLILERAVVALGEKWHEACFCCCACAKPLANDTFYEVMGQLFCEDHFRIMFAARCAGCEAPIAEKAIVALTTKWHPECFKCVRCQQAITDHQFAVQQGQQVCKHCVHAQADNDGNAENDTATWEKANLVTSTCHHHNATD